jgi:RecJ-like exonuclease
VKVSSRLSNKYSGPELNLSEIIRKAAESVGGIGGGHKVAAGATIPKGKEDEFIKKFNQIITDIM